jgi:chaperone BCS1
LHGNPGSGKTSYIQALAGHFNYDISILNLGDRGLTDDRLAHLLVNLPSRSILLLEDIDAAFRKRDESDPRYIGLESLTLSGILNALDGVGSAEERIVFMTTNYPERLDAALIRPGRVDMKVEVGDASDAQAMEMWRKFFSKDEGDEVEFLTSMRKDLGGRNVSCAQLQGHFVFYKGDGRGAIDNIKEILR